MKKPSLEQIADDEARALRAHLEKKTPEEQRELLRAKLAQYLPKRPEHEFEREYAEILQRYRAHSEAVAGRSESESSPEHQREFADIVLSLMKLSLERHLTLPDVAPESLLGAFAGIELARDHLVHERWAHLFQQGYGLGLMFAKLKLDPLTIKGERTKADDVVRGWLGGEAAKEARRKREEPIQKAYRNWRSRHHTDRQAVDEVMKNTQLVASLGRNTVRGYTNPIRDELLIQEAYRRYRSSGIAHEQAIERTFRDKELTRHFNRNKKSAFNVEVVREHSDKVRHEFD